jgi:hypothetical protein
MFPNSFQCFVIFGLMLSVSHCFYYRVKNICGRIKYQEYINILCTGDPYYVLYMVLLIS